MFNILHQLPFITQLNFIKNYIEPENEIAMIRKGYNDETAMV